MPENEDTSEPKRWDGKAQIWYDEELERYFIKTRVSLCGDKNFIVLLGIDIGDANELMKDKCAQIEPVVSVTVSKYVGAGMLNERKPSTKRFAQYEHHDAVVWVRSDLKGKHRQHCLCWSCKKFKPGKEDNCPRARELYELCVKNNMTTPVFECPFFDEQKPAVKLVPTSPPNPEEQAKCQHTPQNMYAMMAGEIVSMCTKCKLVLCRRPPTKEESDKFWENP